MRGGTLEFKERLAELIATQEGDNQSAFARKTGVDASSIRQYLAGSLPTLGKIVAISRAYDVSIDWLVGEKNSPKRDGRTSRDFFPVPMMDIRASAGAGRIAIIDDSEAQVVAFRQDWLRRLGVNPRNALIIMAEGDSMHPTISHGDLVLIDKSIDHVVDEGIYVLVYAGMVKLKRIQVMMNGTVLLKSDNIAYDTEELRAHEVPELVIEGRVRWAGGAI